MKKPSMERKSRTSTDPNRKNNREFAVITYLFVGMFILMMGYFAYFLSLIHI